jgi:very-short-patch-repair endonuclease
LDALSGRAWRRLGSELYCWTALPDDTWLLLSAWQRRLPPDSVFSGATAAWLFGLDLRPTNPIEAIVPSRSGVRSRPGLNMRRRDLPPSDVTRVRGLRTTTVRRTLRDLCHRLVPVEALIVMDAAIHSRIIDKATLFSLHSLATLAAPAESPMETRLRWLLIQARLPHPEVQVDLRDSDGRFVGRADLYFAAAKLIIEYDGANHRDRLVEDNRRQNALINAGFRLLRFAAADMYQRQDAVVAQVRRALTSAGSPV